MVPISVTICCANCEDTIEQACLSVGWADELVVVDSGSTDATATLARRHADRFVTEPWRGYTRQKEFAQELCRNDWIFTLDGDETCSPHLAGELQSLEPAELDRFDLLVVPRRHYLMGRPVRAWEPDLQSRIYHRRRCSWPDQVLHDARMASDPAQVRTLRGWIVHKEHSRGGFSDYFSGRRLDDRLPMVAWQMHREGRRCRWFDLVFRPVMAFWKFYLFKRGFLDGSFGLLVAQKAALSTQLKYAALWAVQQQPVTADGAGESQRDAIEGPRSAGPSSAEGGR